MLIYDCINASLPSGAPVNTGAQKAPYETINSSVQTD